MVGRAKAYVFETTNCLSEQSSELGQNTYRNLDGCQLFSIYPYIYFCADKEPLSTCQKQHMEALKFPATPLRFIAMCKRDGKFEEIQCLQATKECWCVDENGEEINGTRTTGYLKCPSVGRRPD